MKLRYLSIGLCLVITGNLFSQNKNIYQKGWIDFNKMELKIFMKILQNR